MNGLDPADPRVTAAVDVIGRTGAQSFQLRYHDDEEPTVWIAVGTWLYGPRGIPVPDGGQPRSETAAALDPGRAILRLLKLVINGGQCTHCHRPTAIGEDWQPRGVDPETCWYTYDEARQAFVRDCERG
jgi:hypothetical protein